MFDQSILIIEDEQAIADNILYALQSEGFQTDWTSLGRSGITMLQEKQYSLAILDVGLPDCNGFELCKEIRRFSDVPIIFLTARADEIDRVVGLEIGADDYVTKPFSPRELTARVKNILKRIKSDNRQSPLQTPFTLDEQRLQASYFDKPLELTRYEFFILKTLLAEPERVFTREQIMDRVWSEPETSYDRTVDTHIKTLRAKLKNVRDDIDPIMTHRGIGYSLIIP